MEYLPLQFLISGFGGGNQRLTSSIDLPMPTPSIRFARTGATELTPIYGLGFDW